MKRLCLELIKFGPLLVLAMLAEQGFSTELKLNCDTPRKFHSFKIIGKTVVIKKSSQDDRGIRNPATFNANSRTKYTRLGFKKYFSFEGNRYHIKISDMNSLSEVEDFVSIQNSKGHEMTYPLNCKKL
ncbi:MAG: hypothetical protein ACPGJV_06275 [Bacteriovoracaceae bacterium]